MIQKTSATNDAMNEENQEKSKFTIKDRRGNYDQPDTESTEPSQSGERTESQIAGAGQEKGVDDSAGAKAPPIDFSTFVLSLASSAAYHMGGFQDPVSGKTSINLELASQSIDILAMLEEKTRGNLADEETNLISHTLYDLRMKFVEVSKGS